MCFDLAEDFDGRGGTAAQGVPLALDLSSLASVRTFAQTVIGKLAVSPIDVLVLNAGAQVTDLGQRTAEGLKRRLPSITSLITCRCGFCPRALIHSPFAEPRIGSHSVRTLNVCTFEKSRHKEFFSNFRVGYFCIRRPRRNCLTSSDVEAVGSFRHFSTDSTASPCQNLLLSLLLHEVASPLFWRTRCP